MFAAFYLAHKDGVVALFVLAAVEAFKRGSGAAHASNGAPLMPGRCSTPAQRSMPRVAKRSARAFGQQPAHGWRSVSHWQTRACCWRRATGSTAPAGLQRHRVERTGREPDQLARRIAGGDDGQSPVANMPSALRNSREEKLGGSARAGRAGGCSQSSGAGPASKGMELLWSATCARVRRRQPGTLFVWLCFPLSLSWAPAPRC